MLLREIAGQPRQHCRSMRDAAPLHARQHRRHAAAPASRRPCVTCSAARRGLSTLPQPQRHVGVLGGVFGRLRRSATRSKVTCALPVPATCSKGIGVVAELALRPARPCRGRAGRRRARRRSAWCRRKARSSMPRCAKHQPVVFDVLADLEDARVFQQRLQRGERLGFRDLVGRELRRANSPCRRSPPWRWPSGT